MTLLIAWLKKLRIYLVFSCKTWFHLIFSITLREMVVYNCIVNLAPSPKSPKRCILSHVHTIWRETTEEHLKLECDFSQLFSLQFLRALRLRFLVKRKRRSRLVLFNSTWICFDWIIHEYLAPSSIFWLQPLLEEDTGGGLNGAIGTWMFTRRGYRKRGWEWRDD